MGLLSFRQMGNCCREPKEGLEMAVAWSSSQWGQAESPMAVQLENRRLRGSEQCSVLTNIQKEWSQVAGAGLCSVVHSNGTRGTGYRLEPREFCMDTKKNFCAVKVAEPWH